MLTTIVAAAYLLLLGAGGANLPYGIEWADLLAPLLLVSLAIDRGFPRVAAPLHRYVTLYVLSTVVCAIFSVDRRVSAVAAVKDLYLAAVYIAIVALAVRQRREWIAGFLAAGAAVTAAAGLVGVALAAAGIPLNRLGVRMAVPVVGTTFRPSGFLYSPEMLAELLTCTLPLMVWLALRRDHRWWAAVAVAAIAAALTVSHGLAGVLTASLIVLWPVPGPIWRRARWLAATAVVMFAIALNVVSLVAIRDLSIAQGRTSLPPAAFSHAFDDPDGTVPTVDLHVAYSPMSYFALKKLAWATFREHPWLGYGPGTFHLVTERAFGERRLPSLYRDTDPHSTWLGRLAETGLVGTAALAALWAALLIAAARATRAEGVGSDAHAYRAAILGMLVNSINTDVMHFRFLWVVVGLIAAAASARAREPAQSR